ncbi:MAG: DUF6883 domain-containing protein [Cyanobacteria bacterium P01_C01_bin.121]
MKLPNCDRAIITQTKLTEYLLNIKHKRGSSKAQLLIQFGYSINNWKRLDADIRQSHLTQDVDRIRETQYGVRYEIRAPLSTPVGRLLWVKTVWQIDTDTDIPRLITLVPD